MKSFTLSVVLIGFASAALAADPPFAECKPARFANCTIARCTPKTDGSGNYECRCFIDDRYSATNFSPGCIAEKDGIIQSRYYPVEAFQICNDAKTQNPAWAWCLGVKCKLDKKGNPICECPPPPSGVAAFPYVVTTTTFLPKACSINPGGMVWSSAPPSDVQSITVFLQKTHPELKQPEVVIDPAKK